MHNSKQLIFRFKESEIKVLDNISSILTEKLGIKIDRTKAIKYCLSYYLKLQKVMENND